jgi:hypothetical protein
MSDIVAPFGRIPDPDGTTLASAIVAPVLDSRTEHEVTAL